MNRRSFLRGLGGIIAAPAIVRVASLMPVKLWQPPIIERQSFVTFSAIGTREDLTDVIFNISPTEMPFSISPEAS